MRSYKQRVFLFFLAGVGSLCLAAPHPRVVLETNFGNITIELFPEKAPITVDNFLDYVNSNFYDGLVFHRVIDGFMIQAGAYYIEDFTIYPKPPTYGPIINESNNGLRNVRSTISTALSDGADTATSQFFINHVNNPHLDYPNVNGYGHCVFGVVESMDVVDSIALVEVCYFSLALTHFPCNPPVVINQAYVLPCDESYCSDMASAGRIGFEDFAMVASRWLDTSCGSANNFCDEIDLNYSGGVDLADLELFLWHWTRTAGYEPQFSDLVVNNAINLDDLQALMEHWFDTGCDESNAYCGGADINRSGSVDLTDYSVLSNNWLESY
jgi:cyclophilin family peptidyl-prolyl cis-trans isomerase